MDYLIFICEIVYILLCLPSHQCEVCGTLRVVNTVQINQGDDVRLEFAKLRKRDTSLIRWWKNRNLQINTTLQHFSTDVQQDRVTLIIRNVTAEDNGRYTADFGSTSCSSPKDVLVTVKEPKVLSTVLQFPDSVNIPELNCAKCLVGTVGVYNNVECIVIGIRKKDLNMELKLKKNGQDVSNVTVDFSPVYRVFYAYKPSDKEKDHTITCTATGASQQPVTVSITLVILRKPSIPKIIFPGLVKEGENSSITCKTFNARPQPRLYFTYNSTSYKTSNSFSKMKRDNTVDAETILEKPFSRYDNTRSLTCCVEFREYEKNKPKTMKKNCSTSAIDVLFPPKFLEIEELNKSNDEEGNTRLMLQCTSDVSKPVSTIRWNVAPNVKISHEQENIKGLSGHILSANLTRHNNGETLSCYIENPTFPEIKITETYTLNITYKPFISFSPRSPVTTYLDDNITVLCQCDANPAAKIEWSNTSSNEIVERTEVSLELNMQFHSTGRHYFTCKARNTIGSAENTVLIVVKEKLPTSPSTGKGLSSSMLIGIICGCLAVVIIAIVVYGCVIVLKTRKKTPTREESYNVPIPERQPSFQLLDPDHNDPAGSNHSDGPSKAIAEPVVYTCVVKRAVRQATKPQTEEGALIYADLDLPADGSTRRKPTVNSDAETTYVSIDFAQTREMKRSVLDN